MIMMMMMMIMIIIIIVIIIIINNNNIIIIIIISVIPKCTYTASWIHGGGFKQASYRGTSTQSSKYPGML